MRQWVQVVPGDAFGVVMRTNTIHTWWADFTMGKDVCDDLAGDPSTGELASGMFENALEDVVTATTTGITTSTTGARRAVKSTGTDKQCQQS